MPSPVKIARLADVPPGSCRSVQAGGRPLALFNVDGVVYATDGECTHIGGSLGEGFLEGCTIICPLHGATFDVTTGVATGPPAFEDLTTYPVRIDGADVFVEL